MSLMVVVMLVEKEPSGGGFVYCLSRVVASPVAGLARAFRVSVARVKEAAKEEGRRWARERGKTLLHEGLEM